MEKVKKAPWPRLTRSMRATGWVLEVNKPNVKRYAIGNRQIVLVKVAKDKWKVDYYRNSRLVDSAGISDEEFSKIMAIEFGIIKIFRP